VHNSNDRWNSWYWPACNNNCLRFSGLFLCLILISMRQICAQENPGGASQAWMLGAGFHGSRATIIEESFSSVPYFGNSFGVSVLAGYKKKRSIHELKGYFTKGGLQAASPANSTSDQVHVNADYSWLHGIGPGDHSLFVWKAGAGINVLYAQREYNDLINNNESFEFATSLIGIIEAAHFFNKRWDGFSITNRLCLPLVSFVAQPAFGDEGTLGSFGENSQVAGFSSFFRVSNILSLEKKLSGNQKISLFYGWDYYQIRRARRVKQAMHKLGLTYNFVL
jgi:hypothetical protein